MGQNNGATGKRESENGPVGEPKGVADRREVHLERGRNGGLPEVPEPRIVGFDGRDDKMIIPKSLMSVILKALPPSCRRVTLVGSQPPTWLLLYSSFIHGKSFSTMVATIANKGPTVIVIKEQLSDRVFGGFCADDWCSVDTREKRAVSRAAGIQRAQREGQNVDAYAARPSNQANVFFGTDNCFLFSSADGGTIYRPRSSLNSNFMYLFDSHPLEEKEGIGMGGQPGHFGWFLDRWLESGSCHGVTCSTFHSPRLSREENWAVAGVEVYAVHHDTVGQLLSDAAVLQHGGPRPKVSVLSEEADTDADKILLELHGAHKFNRSE